MAGVEINAQKRRAHFTYIWKIEQIPLFADTESPVFTVHSMELTKWSLRICMSLSTCSACLQIRREDQDGGPESIEVEFEISILNAEGKILKKKSCTDHFQKKGPLRSLVSENITEMFDRRGEWFFPKDRLTVRCCIWRTRTEISKFEMCFARTRFNVDHTSCVWAIKGFSSLQEGEKRIRILNSTTKGCPKLILSLSVAEKNGKECIFIHLEAPEVSNYCQVEAEIAVLDDEATDFYLAQVLKFLNIYYKITTLCFFDKRGALLSDDVLLLRCELKLTSFDPVWDRIEDYKLMDFSNSELIQTKKSESHFDEPNGVAVCPFKDIVHAFKEDGTLSDVCLRSGSKSFPVHKLILSSRSPVFRAMFTKDMREKTSKSIDIPDLDADTLGRLLLYIYEDKIEELTSAAAANLFEAADKYELLDLKEKCSCFLKSNIAESNVCDILVLADMHQDETLKNSVRDFVLNNSEIMRSEAWKALKDNHSKLALEITEQIIFSLKNPRS